MNLNFGLVEFWYLFYQNGHAKDYLRTPKCYNFPCLDSRLSPFSRNQFTNLLIYWSRVQRLNVFHKLGSIPTCLACPVVVLPCFYCLVFRTIANPFKGTKTRGALNVIRRICRWKQDEGNWELVGPRPYRVNTIQNGRHVNKGKMHRITIRSGPCGNKMGSSRTLGW